jgi:hypothetical protein
MGNERDDERLHLRNDIGSVTVMRRRIPGGTAGWPGRILRDEGRSPIRSKLRDGPIFIDLADEVPKFAMNDGREEPARIMRAEAQRTRRG